MSAIVGLFCRDGRAIDRADLDRMISRLAHRGLDGARGWSQHEVGLGHLLLRTTPESLHEQQPVVRRSGELVLSADARIDNRGELIDQLGLDSRPTAEIADGEIILSAYERWGEACPEKLLGDFAFAIWDG